MIEEGEKVPALMATLSDGRSLNLAAPGAPLVLYFYPRRHVLCTREGRTSPRWPRTLPRGGDGGRRSREG